MPLFSIIIPVHNGEASLPRCLDSIRNQTEQNYEVLIAENGSADQSVELCRAYEQQDSRFHLFTMGKCDGPSAGRNLGLEQAMGTYIAFIDCDDYVVPDYLQTLHKTFEQKQAQVVFMGRHRVREDGTVLGIDLPHVPDNGDFYETVTALNDQDLFGYTWIKAFRRDTIGNIRFREDLNLLEDEVFTCQVLEKRPNLAAVSEALYYYVTANAGSLMGRTHPDFCRKCSAAFDGWVKLLSSWPGADGYLQKLAEAFAVRCRYYGFEREVPVKQFFGELSETSYFMRCEGAGAYFDAVRKHRYLSLRIQRAVYVWKNRIHVFLRRK